MDARLFELDGIRRFNDLAIQRAVNNALDGIDGKAVVLEVNVDGNGARGVFAVKLDGGWSIGVIGEVDAHRQWHVGARVAKVWS